MACTTAATIKGIKEKIDPGVALGRDLYQMSKEEFDEAGIQRLPRTLSEATALLRADDFFREVLGEQIHKSFCAYKEDEWERYSVYISDWEIEEYLRLY